MTEEAMNLVSKLIEEDASGSRRVIPGGLISQGIRGQGSSAIPQQRVVGIQPETSNLVNDLSRTSNIPVSVSHGAPNIPQNVLPPAVSPSSMEVWYYRDPQGSVQGPFSNPEMALWCSQGYFSGSLLLRRECDKIFISLAEMGKLYGGNPFLSTDNPPPPLSQDISPLSALDFTRGDASQMQAQFRQQQLLQQQSALREQYIMK